MILSHIDRFSHSQTELSLKCYKHFLKKVFFVFTHNL